MHVFRPIPAVAWSLAILLSVSACQQRTVADRASPRQAAPSAPAQQIRSADAMTPVKPPSSDQSRIQPRLPSPTPTRPPAPVHPDPTAAVPVQGAVTLRPPPLRAADIGDGMRIALMLPLSGRDADLGASMLRAAQLALFDIAGSDFILMPYDTAGDPARARA